VVRSYSLVEKWIDGGNSPTSRRDGDPKFWPALAHSLLLLECYDDALFNFNRSLEVICDDAALWNGRGKCLVVGNRYEEALSDFSKALELNESVSEFWYDRGLTYSKLERYDKAASDLGRATVIDDKVRAYWSERGKCLAAMKRYSEAVVDFTECLRNTSSSIPLDMVGALKDRGDCYFELKEYNNAYNDYNGACKDYYASCTSKDSLLWYRYGVCKRKTGSFSDVEFSKAIRLRINLSDCWIQRGDYFFEQGKLSRAEKDYLKASSMDDTNPEYWYKHASCVFQLGKKYDVALESYTKAITLNEKEQKYWYERGMCYKEIGRVEEAEMDLKKASELQSASDGNDPASTSSPEDNGQEFSSKRVKLLPPHEGGEEKEEKDEIIMSDVSQQLGSTMSSTSIERHEITSSSLTETGILLESNVGSIAVKRWERDIMDRGRSNLFETYKYIGCRQTSYSRMKVWLNLAMERTKAHKALVEKLLAVLSFVSQGFEMNPIEHEYAGIMGSQELGSTCLVLAQREPCMSRLRAWLRLGSTFDSVAGYKCIMNESSIMFSSKDEGCRLRYKRCEAAAAIKRALYSLPSPNQFMDTLQRMRGFNVDDGAVYSFYLQTLLCGSLDRNQTSSLYRCFFSSGLREVHLLPLIAGYLGEKNINGVNEREVSYHDIEQYRNPQNTLDVCRCLLEHEDSRGKVNRLIFTSQFQYVPLYLSLYLSVTSLDYSHRDTTTSYHLDLSHLSYMDTSKLTSLVVSGCVVSSLSPLSQYDLSHLQRLFFFCTSGVQNLIGLTTNNTASLKKLSITCPNLVDISVLKDCNLSSLEELKLGGPLSDISCLKDLSFPMLRKCDLRRTKISDISVLSTWKGLSSIFFNLEGCPIEDITPLSLMCFLRSGSTRFSLQHTLVFDLSPLENLSHNGGGKVDVYMGGTPAGQKMMDEGKKSQTIGSVTVHYLRVTNVR